ncbi:hypothetical protein PUN28_013780 [Cardiocondyla obscurior]|uniref:Uncharacterized protein n=1 Tax=Cardiocondyla obscurior TaxID=286306 RepID=A0AAW2F8V0_9HYME
MSFFDAFRNFFGKGYQNEPGTNGFGNANFRQESFRNPIWQNDEDDDDEMDSFWHTSSDMHFKIFNNPIEISHFLESEMQNVMKHFFDFGGNSIQERAISTIPFEIPKNNGGLRDKVLKAKIDQPAIANVPFHDKIDTDLDGSISTQTFSKMWINNAEVQKNPAQNNGSFGKYIRREVICKSDGTIEKKQTIRDTEGNEKTTMSTEKGNNMHVVTITKNKSGVQKTSEDLVKMDKNNTDENEDKLV